MEYDGERDTNRAPDARRQLDIRIALVLGAAMGALFASTAMNWGQPWSAANISVSVGASLAGVGIGLLIKPWLYRGVR